MRQPRPYCLMMRSRLTGGAELTLSALPPSLTLPRTRGREGWGHPPHQRAIAAVPVKRRLGGRDAAPGIDGAAQHEAGDVLHLVGRLALDRMPVQVLELLARRERARGVRTVGDEEAGMEANGRVCGRDGAADEAEQVGRRRETVARIGLLDRRERAVAARR